MSLKVGDRVRQVRTPMYGYYYSEPKDAVGVVSEIVDGAPFPILVTYEDATLPGDYPYVVEELEKVEDEDA